MAPVGHASRHPARAQCLHTSDIISQRSDCSTKATCRQVAAPSAMVLSYERPLKTKPSSGSWFHCLHATSQALQPIQTVVSVKNPVATYVSSPRVWRDVTTPCFPGILRRAGGRSRHAGVAGVRTGAKCFLRPGSMLPVNAFDSWIETLGSPTNEIRWLAESPRTSPALPQWYGRPIW